MKKDVGDKGFTSEVLEQGNFRSSTRKDMAFAIDVCNRLLRFRPSLHGKTPELIPLAAAFGSWLIHSIDMRIVSSQAGAEG